MKTQKIEAYLLAEFCQKIEGLLKEGWKFDFETNDNYPTSYGSFYQATLVQKNQESDKPVEEIKLKVEVDSDGVVEVNVTTDSEEPKKTKRGPKPKVEATE
jgi:hypothetical protein